MPRILVVADETLREALEVHFADGSAQVTTAPAARSARIQALLEKPTVVVCREASLDIPVVEFWNELRKAGLEDAQLVCVGDGATTSENATFCAEDELLETVAASIEPQGRTPASRDPIKKVQMLASLSRLEGDGPNLTPSFVNLLGVGETRLVFESPAPLSLGESFSMSFFIRGEGVHQRISLGCRVSSIVNDSQLHYEAEILEIDDESKQLLDMFLANRNRSGAY